MKRIILAFILGLNIVSTMPAMESAKNALLCLSKANERTHSVVPSVAASYALTYSLIYAHELGHALADKILLGARSRIYVSPFLVTGGYQEPIGYSKKIDTLSLESVKKRRALVLLAGPIAGLLATILALKTYDIFNEYNLHMSNNFLKACSQGLQKSIFNSDRSLYFQVPAIWSLCVNIAAFTDFKNEGSDISQALENLNITNPKVLYPRLTKILGYLLPISIGMFGGYVISK
jgi:hypothetical protein